MVGTNQDFFRFSYDCWQVISLTQVKVPQVPIAGVMWHSYYIMIFTYINQHETFTVVFETVYEVFVRQAKNRLQ